VTRDVGHQRNDGLLELGENSLELGRRHAGLVAAEQGVVWTVLEAESVGDLAVQLDILLEVRREEAEVLFLPGLLPDGPGCRSRAGDLRHQVRRQLD